MLNDLRLMFRGRDRFGPAIAVMSLLAYGMVFAWACDVALSSWGL